MGGTGINEEKLGIMCLLNLIWFSRITASLDIHILRWKLPVIFRCLENQLTVQCQKKWKNKALSRQIIGVISQMQL
jgi:hypothetical protein